MTVGFQKDNLIGFLMTLTVFFPDIFFFGWTILKGFFKKIYFAICYCQMESGGLREHFIG